MATSSTSSLSTIGSGMDIPTVVAALVSKERAPVENRINSQGTAAQTQLSAVGTIKSALANLQSALSTVVGSADTPSYAATVDSAAGFTATTAEGATAGTYSVEVTSLATQQKLTSAAYASDASVGSGTLKIAYGTKSLSVSVAEGATLTDLAAAINKAAGGNVVTASVVTANDGQHLVLNAASTGTAGALTITSADNSLQAFTYGATDSSGTAVSGLTQTVAATDAVVSVDGFQRTSSSNAISDLIPGVTLNLTKAVAGTSYNLTVASDNKSIKSNIAALVTAYNTTMSTLKASSSYNAETQTASALTGDAMVRGLTQSLRGQISGNLVAMKALGLSLDKDGVLSFDSGKFDSAVASSPADVKKMLGKDGLFSAPMTTLLDSNLNSTSGVLTQRTNSLAKQINDLKDDLSDLDKRMETLTTQYTARFTAMENMVTQMQASSDYISKLTTS